MRLGATVEGDLKRMGVEIIDDLSAIGTDAVNRAAAGLRDEYRQQVKRAGLGGDLAKAWQSKTYPLRRKSLGATGWVFSKSRRIHEAFSMPRTVTARGGRWLVVPLEGAVRRNWHLGGSGGLIGAKPRKWSDFGQVMKLKGVMWLQRRDGRVVIALRGPAKSPPEPLFLLTRSVRLKGGLDLPGPAQRWLNSLHAELAAKIGG